MLWILLLLALGLSALWYGIDSTEHSEVGEEELLATYGMVWQHNDPLAYGQAAELAAARIMARTYTVPPMRGISRPVSKAN